MTYLFTNSFTLTIQMFCVVTLFVWVSKESNCFIIKDKEVEKEG
jgi:hypothetical protein